MNRHPQLVWIDAFTDRPFAGNPAAVCLFSDRGEAIPVADAEAGAETLWPLSDTKMQALARELGLSETAFLRPRDETGTEWDLRWFTPAAEVELCGHATLASAHALWEMERAAAGSDLLFHTLSGVLSARRPDPAIDDPGHAALADETSARQVAAPDDQGQEASDWVELDFPARPALARQAPPGLLSGLGVEAEWVGHNGDDWLVEVASESIVRLARPDLSALSHVPARGVILTALADEDRGGPGGDYDFLSRFFAPSVGVDEDPVTGSAHCALAPHWCGRLGRERLIGYQASPRGGRVRVHHRGDRVGLAGQAVTVTRGELRVPLD